MDELRIRKARIDDYACIASHIMLAMNDLIYRFTGENSREKALAFVEELVREPGNQYSYENCWVMHDGRQVVATAVVYDGARLAGLREPVIRKIREQFHRDFNPEDETEAGEVYIDCVGVNPDRQGQGIGSKLFRFLIDEYVHRRRQTLGLLVDEDNPGARQLYLRLGFKVFDERRLTGKKMVKMRVEPGVRS